MSDGIVPAAGQRPDPVETVCSGAIQQIYEGTSDIQLLVIARRIAGEG